MWFASFCEGNIFSPFRDKGRFLSLADKLHCQSTTDIFSRCPAYIGNSDFNFDGLARRKEELTIFPIVRICVFRAAAAEFKFQPGTLFYFQSALLFHQLISESLKLLRHGNACFSRISSCLLSRCTKQISLKCHFSELLKYQPSSYGCSHKGTGRNH